jgi:CheY-like chemotaxis protein
MAAEPPQGGKETILVVEDEKALRHVVRRILSSAGYTVLVAESGAEALLVCKQHPGTIHLVLTDMIMPIMSGIVLVERLGGLRPETQFLYMSGYSDEAIDERGPVDRARFIGKPFTSEALLRKVREILDSPRQADKLPKDQL